MSAPDADEIDRLRKGYEDARARELDAASEASGFAQELSDLGVEVEDD